MTERLQMYVDEDNIRTSAEQNGISTSVSTVKMREQHKIKTKPNLFLTFN